MVTYPTLLFVNVATQILYIASKTKVSNLAHLIVIDQYVAGSQISVDDLLQANEKQ